MYFDNAATTRMKPQCVIDAVCDAMTSMGNASRGAHGSALSASRVVYHTRAKLAEMFHCKRPDHVILTMNATESLNIAIRGAIAPGSHVITTQMEHNSVLRPLYLLEKEKDVTLSFVKADKGGNVKPEQFEELITPQTKAIVCTHASNLTGNVVDIEAVGAICKRHGLLFIVDASQTTGVLPIDMERMNIDILCFTGHKGLMGPQGTGGMCIREGVEVEVFKCGGSGVHSYDKEQPRDYPTRLEAGTLNGHGIAGLYAALNYIEEVGISAIEQKENSLAMRFYEGIRHIDGIRIYSDMKAKQHTGVVALNIRDYDSAMVADALSEDYDMATRAGAHCAPLMHQALGTTEQGAVRFSFSWFNTEEEVDAAIAAIRELAEE
ncbi:MAG: aminotransferase class V-fold PLP-dependent enzyme [Lachnospiraceae bacterium]|jgi:cysteine desulfurase family protein|nr:aminotransferase class V-fold PLP-dependent enzyme [Lachnospiraceae bacterium]